MDIPDGVKNYGPYETNKFYANLFLGDQSYMVWTYPYGFYWSKTANFGFAVQHTNPDNRVKGSTDSNGAISYYYNPILEGELIFSATTITEDDNYMSVTNMEAMSANVKLSPESVSSDNNIEIPLVQGMGFATAIYNGNLIPQLNTIYAFTALVQETVASSNPLVQRYRVTLNSGIQWLIFVTLPSADTEFTFLATTSALVGSASVDGLIVQLAVAPETGLESYYFESAGTYVTTADVVGSVNCEDVVYRFEYTSEGSSIANTPIVFALPHHLDTLEPWVLASSTGIELESTVKGTMQGFVTGILAFTETINTDVQFYPWVQGMGTTITYTAEQIELIHTVALDEIDGVDIVSTITDLDSVYYMGKYVDKYAYILLTLSDVVQDEANAKALLATLKEFFEKFSNGDIYYPLMYDNKFRGVTSTANNDGDSSLDFGSGYYNDHHFHYGYIVHAAAIVGYVDLLYDGTWIADNKGWVNALIRDVANPNLADIYFPVSRSFDWYQGHSWAKGLFAGGDGKDEESSSEDYNFSYAMKLWGKLIGDNAMEARGDLMLSIASRSMNLYFLYSDDNTVEPSDLIANKVSGILFDNKITYTTYFGSNTEYIHGIHMLPITPASSLIRGPTFVEEEWDQVLETVVGSVTGGYRGILELNAALFNGELAYSYFSSSSFDSSNLDNGQSRTWSLAFSAAVYNN